MNKEIEEQFVSQIQNNAKIMHKVIGLYVDHEKDREDLFQEITLQAWKSFPNFNEQSTFSTWLYKVALNTVFSFNRKTNKTKTVELTVLAEKEAPQEKEDYEILRYLIKQFNEIDRMLISLHLDGYKNQEIAEITGLTPNHVNVKVFRLKNQIVENYKKFQDGYL